MDNGPTRYLVSWSTHMTVLFAQASGKGASSAEFAITEPTLVTVTGAVNAVGAGMAISMKKGAGYQLFDTLRAPNQAGLLPKGSYIATRLGDASTGLESSVA